MARASLLDLEKQFGGFIAYHTHPINILLHILTAWPIFFTILLLLYFTPPFFQLPASVTNSLPTLLGKALVFNVGFFATLFYAVFWACLDIKAGSLSGLLLILCWVGTDVVGSKLGFLDSFKLIVVAQVISWTLQYIGHEVFEKRRPDPVDNLIQAFLFLPCFLLIMVLQKIGYEPYPGFQDHVLAIKEAERKAWEEKNKNKSQ